MIFKNSLNYISQFFFFFTSKARNFYLNSNIYNKKIGVSLNPNTSIDIIKNVLKSIDLVLIMSVHPGFGGQKFIPDIVKKIRDLNKIKTKENLNFDIEVDGGINFENSKLVIEAGANILVSGTTIFKNNNCNIKKNIDTLKTS